MPPIHDFHHISEEQVAEKYTIDNRWIKMLMCLLEQEAVKTAVRTAGMAASVVLLEETPSPRAAFLESFPSLNPFAAARLAGLPCSTQQLLSSNFEDQQKLGQIFPDIPQRSLELLFKQASCGAPVLQGTHIT